MQAKRVLFITTSQDTIGSDDTGTGVWLEDLATPYYVFKDGGAEVTIASPKGGAVPIDPKSEGIIIVTRSGKRFLKDPEAMLFLSQSLVLDTVNADNFDLVFVPGGHGLLWDFTGNQLLKELLSCFYKAGKPMGLVSQGVAGLLLLQDDAGDYLINGKALTAFSNSEEESKGMANRLPFLLETKLIESGALYSKGTNYVDYTMAAGNIVTGQNPASSESVAKKVIAMAVNN